ncbi:MAG: hypothetical protein PHU85_19280 [Phycisphaerae bacterium]|nr:hypothetical protein [Phycisphaerae bacterium]
MRAPWPITFAICLLAATAAGQTTQPTTQPAVSAAVRALIADLGAQRPDVRENAQATLRRIGPKAIPALEEACRSDNPEVRVRARDVLADVRMGVQPDWPADVVLLMRHYAKLPENERVKAINRVAEAIQENSAPFLDVCIRQGRTEPEVATAQRQMARIRRDRLYTPTTSQPATKPAITIDVPEYMP